MTNKLILFLKKKRREFIRAKPIPKYFRISEFIEPNSKILDLGCGKGALSKFLLQKDVFIVGCDLERKIEFKHKNFLYKQLDLDKKFPFKEKFDVIILSDVLEHLKNPKEVFKKASKLTNKFIVSLPNLDFLMYKLFPNLENPPKGESQHLHHWKFNDFLKIIPAGFKINRISYCSDFPEFRFTNFIFPNLKFFNQGIILEIIKK